MIKQWIIHLFNFHRKKIFVEDDQVIGVDGRLRFVVPLIDIEAILEVNYTSVSFDTDIFHILLLKDRFFLMGMCTEYDTSMIIDKIKILSSSLNIISVEFEQIPWCLRDRGCLGLRFFDLAGMGIFPLHYLPKYTLLHPHNLSE